MDYEYDCEMEENTKGECSFEGTIKLKSLKEEPEKVTMELEIDIPDISILKNVDTEYDDEIKLPFTVISPTYHAEYKGNFRVKFQQWIHFYMATDTIYGHKLSITSGEVIDTSYNLKVSNGYQTVTHKSKKIDRSYDLCGIRTKKNVGPPQSIEGTVKVIFKPTEDGPPMKRLKK